MNQTQRTLSSPNINVAQKTVLAITDASTKIKAAIVEALKNNLSQEELTKKLNKIISDTVKQFDNPALQEDMRRGLVVSARKWHYELTETFKVLNTNIVNEARKKGLNLSNDVYSFGFGNSNIIIDRVRPFIDHNAKGLAIIENYEKQVKTALKALSAEPPKIVKVTRKDGVEYTYTMSARNRAEIAARYEANLKDLNDLITKGVKYVWTTSHPNCSNRCKPHQGKLYSLDPNDKSGTIDGNRYTFLGDVLVLNEGNSIINGYNCRHRLVEYAKGSIAPDEYTEEEIKKEYSIDSRQRNYENNIRQLKTEERLQRASGNLEEAKKLRKQWRRLNKNYEIFSLKNGRAYYPWRTRVSEDEKDYTIANKDADNKINVDNAEKDGIIKAKYEDINDAYAYVKLNKLDDELKGKMEERLLKLSNDFPTNTKGLKVIQTNRSGVFGYHSIGFTTPKKQGKHYVSFKNEIAISENYTSSLTRNDAVKRTYKKCGSKLEHITGASITTITHEYAHQIDRDYLISNDSSIQKIIQDYDGKEYDNSMYSVLKEANDKFRNSKNLMSSIIYEDMKKHLALNDYEFREEINKNYGSYALGAKLEFFAEAFANMIHLEEVDKTDFMRLFEKHFNEEFKKIKEW